LHWIKGGGYHKQFVANRVHKIQQHPEVQWHHVSTKDSPADIVEWTGYWLPKRQKWPTDIETKTTPESQAEAKVIREVLAAAQVQEVNLDTLLGKFTLWQTLCPLG